MGICERCGANAVDQQGICRNCGYQAPNDAYNDDASLGETRAADPVAPPLGSRYAGADYGATAAMATHAPLSAPVSGGASGAGTARFCGVCGARITGSEAFCGQCGAPVTPSGAGARVGGQPPASRYQVGPAGWDGDPNAYTEALPEAPLVAASRNPYGGGDAFARSYAPAYGATGRGSVTPAPSSGGMSRGTKITLGVVFLVLSIILALIAVAALTVGL